MEKLHAALLDAFEGKNEAEFKQNYSENTRGWNAVRYEDCGLDFVPVTEREYLVVDRSEGRLCGTYTVSSYVENEKTEKTITSLLIADEWDVRKALPVVLEKRWTNVYFLLNEAAPKFASFFKVKGFLASLPPNVKFFATAEEMRRYFLETPGVYLPRKIVAPETEKYEELIEELHEARIRSGVPSDHVLLSVCIPTYNRGALALEAVETALRSQYDAEIEIFVSDNGSEIEKEAYEQIADIRDSRLRYGRNKENFGYAYNIMNCLKKAKGHFAFFSSDEDSVVVENIGAALDWLINHSSNIGACVFSGSEELGYISEEQVFSAGIDAIIKACYMNYITGVCMNLDYIRSLGLIEEIEKYRENDYYKNYTHCAMGALVGRQADLMNVPIELWRYEGERSKTHDWGIKNGLVAGLLPESRLPQEQGIIEMMANYISGDDLEKLFLDRIFEFFSLVSLYYKSKIHGEDLKNLYHWLDIWMTHYRSCLQILGELEGKLKDTASVIFKMNKTFFYWIICKREQRWHTPEENLLPCLQAQVAKYYYDKGIPIEEIDFPGIEKDLEGWVRDFLSKRN